MGPPSIVSHWLDAEDTVFSKTWFLPLSLMESVTETRAAGQRGER